MRLGDWKAVRNGQDQPIELYEVKYDVGETENVAAKHPQIIARMEQIMATSAAPDPKCPIAPPQVPSPKRSEILEQLVNVLPDMEAAQTLCLCLDFPAFRKKVSCMRSLRLSLLGCLALVAGFITAKAELPPTAYEQFQSAAPEVFQIKVGQVSSKFPGVFDRSKRIETVQATVLKVVRSKSGTKPGDKITLRYERIMPKDGWAGPSPAPALDKGKEYPAYLSKSADGTFELGAKGKSFETVTSKPK